MLIVKLSIMVFSVLVVASNYRMSWLLMIIDVSLILCISGVKQVNLRPIIRVVTLGILAIVTVSVIGAMKDSKIFLELERSIEQRIIQFSWSNQESYRGEMWNGAIERWESSPFLGVGFGSKFDYAVEAPDGSWRWEEAKSFHNSYLELLLKSGVFGLIVFICLQFSILAQCWKVLRLCPGVAALASATIVYMCSVLIQTGFQPLLTEPNFIVLSYMTVGVILSLNHNLNKVDCGKC